MWFVHTVQVQTKGGNGFKGQSVSAPVSVQCWVEDSTNDVRDADGNLTTSTATVFAGLGERLTFPVGSEVTLPGGRTAQVLHVGVYDSGTLQLGLDHIEVHLT
jgi:hypothetical protein